MVMNFRTTNMWVKGVAYPFHIFLVNLPRMLIGFTATITTWPHYHQHHSGVQSGRIVVHLLDFFIFLDLLCLIERKCAWRGMTMAPSIITENNREYHRDEYKTVLGAMESLTKVLRLISSEVHIKTNIKSLYTRPHLAPINRMHCK